MDNLIILNNLDILCSNNFIIQRFISKQKCIETCNIRNCNVFTVQKDIVFYKKIDIKSAIENICYNSESTVFIFDKNNLFKKQHYILDKKERLDIYCKGLLTLKNHVFNKNHKYYKKIETIQQFLNTEKREQWIYQHYSNILKFISYVEEKPEEFNFNPYDLSWSQEYPTFVKSRKLSDPKNSILLPLEDLYIPSFYIDILNSDIGFESKLDTCVWRGVNSGNFFNIVDKTRANRRDLVLKYCFHDTFNIGLSFANYKPSGNVNFDVNKYVKSKISIKEQLKYKYIISVEGNDFATNLSWIMLSNSVPLMPIPFVETWKIESKLVPYVHYVPLNNDFSDLEEKIEWCNNNRDKCKNIAFMSRVYVLQFFNNNLEKEIITDIIHFYKEKTHSL
jgi:hypothetical protein